MRHFRQQRKEIMCAVDAGCNMGVVVLDEALVEFVHVAFALSGRGDAKGKGQDKGSLGSAIVLGVDGGGDVGCELGVSCGVGVIG